MSTSDTPSLTPEQWRRLPVTLIPLKRLRITLHDMRATHVVGYLERRDDTPIWAAPAAGDPELLDVHDGRHRAVAALLDGRTHLPGHLSDRPERS